MKKHFLTYAATIFCMTATTLFSACSDDNSSTDEPQSKLSVTVTAGTAKSTSLTFTITSEGAEICAWDCIAKGEAQPTAAEILQSGNKVPTDKVSTPQVSNLDPETTYVIVAAVSDKAGNVASATPVEMTTTESRFEADVLIDATYRNDNSAGAGNYVFVISNNEPNANGDPANVGDFQVQLDLYNEADSDPVNASLPVGTYRMGADMSAFTWDPQRSALIVRSDAGADGVTVAAMIDGTVKVERSGMNYSLTIDMTLHTGEQLKVGYEGPIPFVQGGSSAYGRFTTPQQIEFSHCQGRFYANWFYPHADDMTIEMFSGTFDDYGTLVDGYYLTMPVYMPKIDNPEAEQNPRFSAGIYDIVSTPSASYYNIPYTISKGQYVEVLGQMTEIGAYVKHIDSKTGKRTLGLFDRGTVEVSLSGNTYTIKIDMVTPEGVSITGTFNGQMLINKFVNNSSMPARPWSSLTEDYTLVLPETTIAGGFYLGDGYIVPGFGSWMIMVMNDNGDMVTTDLLVPGGKGMTVPTGTFGVSNSLAENTAISGYKQFGGDILYTWYGDLGSLNAEGYHDRLAPISEGSITISEVGNQYKFVFDLIDDKGNKITGEWTGKVDVEDYTNPTANKARYALRSAKR